MVIALLQAEESGKIVSLLKQHALGVGAVVIGEIVSAEDAGSSVTMKTKSGGTRIVAMPIGSQYQGYVGNRKVHECQKSKIV